MTDVLVVQAFHADGVAMLTARPDLRVRVIEDMSPAALSASVADAAVITVRNQPLTRELLDHAPNLVCVAKHGVGVDKIDIPYLTGRNIPVINTPGANALSVAEQTLALMLAVAKRIPLNDRAVREGRFGIRETQNTCCLGEKNVLICGFGRIGRAVAKLCAGFDMKIFYHDPFLPADAPAFPDATRVTDLPAALGGMDYVSLHMPLTPATRYLFNRDAFARMKPSAIVINAARGGVLHEKDLYEALQQGFIAGAGLDVFEKEPAPADNPLFGLDSVVVSPHNAALSREGALRMGTETAANVIRFVAGEIDPGCVVNPAVLDSPDFKARWTALRGG